MNSKKRDELIERMVRAEVARWDTDTLEQYAVDMMIEYMTDANNEELATMYEQLISEDNNPFDGE